MTSSNQVNSLLQEELEEEEEEDYEDEDEADAEAEAEAEEEVVKAPPFPPTTSPLPRSRGLKPKREWGLPQLEGLEGDALFEALLGDPLLFVQHVAHPSYSSHPDPPASTPLHPPHSHPHSCLHHDDNDGLAAWRQSESLSLGLVPPPPLLRPALLVPPQAVLGVHPAEGGTDSGALPGELEVLLVLGDGRQVAVRPAELEGDPRVAGLLVAHLEALTPHVPDPPRPSPRAPRITGRRHEMDGAGRRRVAYRIEDASGVQWRRHEELAPLERALVRQYRQQPLPLPAPAPDAQPRRFWERPAGTPQPRPWGTLEED